MALIDSSSLTEGVMLAKTTKNSLIKNPLTGDISFGRIPPNNSNIMEGDIYLKLGDVGFGRDRRGGYGARHIWDKHKRDLSINSPEDIALVICNILQDGVDVFVDFSASITRPVILNSAIGRVVIEKKQIGGSCAYSIISAYGSRVAKGTLIGNLLPPI